MRYPIRTHDIVAYEIKELKKNPGEMQEAVMNQRSNSRRSAVLQERRKLAEYMCQALLLGLQMLCF